MVALDSCLPSAFPLERQSWRSSSRNKIWGNIRNGIIKPPSPGALDPTNNPNPELRLAGNVGINVFGIVSCGFERGFNVSLGLHPRGLITLPEEFALRVRSRRSCPQQVSDIWLSRTWVFRGALVLRICRPPGRLALMGQGTKPSRLKEKIANGGTKRHHISSIDNTDHEYNK